MFFQWLVSYLNLLIKQPILSLTICNATYKYEIPPTLESVLSTLFSTSIKLLLLM